MTLKTFHFAGVASMNITLGVPRIKEIINASKVISTPIITAILVTKNDLKSARIVKGRIEKTTLEDVSEYIEEVIKGKKSYIKIKIDLEAIQKLQLEVDIFSISESIANAPKLKINESNIRIVYPDRIHVHVLAKDETSTFFDLQNLRRVLPHVIIKGIPTVNRAVISEEKGNLHLLVEGYGLREVMSMAGVNGPETKSNHVLESQKVLGIEAARNTIIEQIMYTMGKHGMTIDSRHVMLLADLMTFKVRNDLKIFFFYVYKSIIFFLIF